VQPKKKKKLHRRDTEFAEFGVYLDHKNYLLRVLGASAVSFPKIFASRANFEL
jgi:hypothetical protein